MLNKSTEDRLSSNIGCTVHFGLSLLYLSAFECLAFLLLHSKSTLSDINILRKDYLLFRLPHDSTARSDSHKAHGSD